MPSVTTEQVVEVKISPALKTKLVKKLRAFGLNKQTIDALGHAQTKLKSEIEQLFIEAGEFNSLQEGVKADGFNVRHVSPITSRFDKKKAISRGYITTAQIDECSQAKPGRPYVVIRTPGEADEQAHDE